MFISKSEKEEIRIGMQTLKAEVKSLRHLLENLDGRVSEKEKAEEIKKKPTKWTDEQKKKASDRMKKKWSEIKAKKDAS